MSVLGSTGSVRRRARAAGPPAPLPPGATPPNPPDSPRRHLLSPSRAEPLEPRRLLAAFTVTTEADAGPGSLRQAILDANDASGADAIAFAIAGEAGAVHTIRPQSPLPSITDSVTLDATTQSGYSTSPLIELDGSASGATADGLTLVAGSIDVIGLAINRFSRDGVSVPATGDIRGIRNVVSCFIGTDPSGASALANGGAGVGVDANSVRVSNCVISGNTGPGVWLRGRQPASAGLSVLGSRIGTNAAGTAALPNAEGILLESPATAYIGDGIEPVPYHPLARNVISGNAGSGVRIVGATLRSYVWGNFIGTDVTGAYAIPNGQDPAAASHDGVTVIGGTSTTSFPYTGVRGNLISGNAGAGVSLRAEGARYMFGEIAQNTIGTNAASTAAVPNGGDGIFASGLTSLGIGGNTIAGNRGNGVLYVGDPTQFSVSGPKITGNVIGVTRNAVPIPNRGNGIELRDAAHVTIGGPNPPDGGLIRPFASMPAVTVQNVVGANAGHGIMISGRGDPSAKSDIAVVNNRIGVVDPEAGPTAGNGGSGIYLSGVNGVTIGGNVVVPGGEGTPGYTVAAGNLIGGNAGDGITITNAGTTPSLNVRIEKNDIGVRPSGAPVGNGGWGVNMAGSSLVSVGGDALGAGNRIACNARGGVSVRYADTRGSGWYFGPSSERNPILRNSIYDNGGPGIDLGADGVTPNDVGDLDSGANGLQNAPSIIGMIDDGVRTYIRLEVLSHPTVLHRLHVYASPTGAIPEGKVFLGAGEQYTASPIAVVVVFTSSLPRNGWLTATATDPDGNTSEFSPAVNVAGLRPAYRPARPDVAPPPRGPLATVAAPRRRVAIPRDLLT